jgi:hypothetical protein
VEETAGGAASISQRGAVPVAALRPDLVTADATSTGIKSLVSNPTSPRLLLLHLLPRVSLTLFLVGTWNTAQQGKS